MSNAFNKRYDLADKLTDELVELAKAKGEKYTVAGESAYAYATGYIRSVLQSVAAQSPASMERLEQALQAARYKG